MIRLRPRIAAAVGGPAAVAVALAATVVIGSRERHVASTQPMASSISTQDLGRVARTRVFFGHQSVGGNLLDGVRTVFAEHGMAPPTTARQRTGAADPAGSITHDLIGENEQPLSKIADFDAVIRSGMGEQVDVAMMKLCYVDVRSDTDVEALFAAYRDTLAALQRDFPDVRFLAVTVPLTTEPGPKTRVKQFLTRSDRFGPAENVRREELNTLLRQEYGDGRLFDLAAAESTAPDGTRSRGSHDGREYFHLDPGYASDLGHLDAEGARWVAEAWLAAVAGATEG